VAEPRTAGTYLPALRFRSLTRFYDPFIRRTTREDSFKPRLLEQAAIGDGDRVLDLGCGTGTLAVMAKQASPGAEVTGLDADPEVLEQATEKAKRAEVAIAFRQGMSNELPYEDASFDRVLSSLFFHHLSGADKRTTLAEVTRVLKPRGELHVADFGRASDPVMLGIFTVLRLFDGLENTRDNAAGRLPQLFEEAGLVDATEHDRFRTAFGTLALYSAIKN
jgi:ubiquinone/menaquinone biosynthesis C-methylase UbiE